jgi:hypothetical protein
MLNRVASIQKFEVAFVMEIAIPLQSVIITAEASGETNPQSNDVD